MKKYDILIIGGGPAGLTAGIYAGRNGMKTLLFEKTVLGGQLALAEKVENYPGFPDGISGAELVRRFEKQAEKFGVEIKTEEILKLNFDTSEGITVETSFGKYETTSVIVATGAAARHLNISGEEEFIGKGVSYCATCDGPFFKDKEVAVIGGGDAALGEAVYLTRFASKVYLIHRRERLRVAKIIQEKAFTNPKIEPVLETQVRKISGAQAVEKVILENVKTGLQKELALSGIFIFAGRVPDTKIPGCQVEMDEKGYIKVSPDMKTSRKGVFACGDCVKKMLFQVVTAAGEGAAAAFSASKFVEEVKGTPYD